MKIKEEESTDTGRRRSGRLAKARTAKKNPNDGEDEASRDQETPCLATSSQSNTPMASPSFSPNDADQVTNGENANHTNHGSPAPPPPSTKPTPKPIISIQRETEPAPPFVRIDENVYLFDRKRSKNHKDKMVCDCILTKEERQRGLSGCGEDCLNRILMIECSSRCPVGNDCANKRFQKRQYVKCEPFRAGKKGWGLRVLERVDPGTFIMEYVGEVVNPSEFKARVRKCAKEKKEHHYFMALKSDEIIDATLKGNMTRFVNHSCEPSCETQKWTVNGDLRVGFFSIKALEPGDEVTFNYKFERYGKKAQPCYCETPSCQGVIGGSGTSKIAIDGTRFTAEEMEDIKEYDEILEQDKDAFEDLALGAEIEKLCEVGYLKNKRQVMTLARIMLRTEDNDDRMKLLNVLNETKEPVFRRLFIDYHGLKLLWSWMVETDNIFVKAGILQVLSLLPIPNRTVLSESRVLEVVERWATEPDPIIFPLPAVVKDEQPKSSNEDENKDIIVETTNLIKEETSDETVKVPTDEEIKAEVNDVPIVDDLGGFQEETSTTMVERAKIKITIISKKEEKKEDVKPEPSELPPPNIAAISRKLLQMWKNLKEAYKIPRLVLKNRKDDEMAADAFEEAEKTAKSEVSVSNQDRKLVQELNKPRPYDWIINPLRSRTGEKSSDFTNQMNSQGIESTILDEGPKESKVAHRMNFEMELLKEKYERDMEALRVEAEETKRKLQMMEVQQASLAGVFPTAPIPIDPYHHHHSVFPQSPDAMVVDTPAYGLEEPYSQSADYYHSVPCEDDCDYNNVPEENNEHVHEEWPKITIDNLSNIVIECTARNLHALQSDDEAVVSMDYGIEFVPKKKRKFDNDRELFDSLYPAPGIYFDFGDKNIHYTSFLENQDGLCEFTSLPTRNLFTESTSETDEIFGPLPQNWRRARDEKNGKSYFFHRRSAEVRWTLPPGPKIKDSNDLNDEPIGKTNESIVATADSTSCVGTGTATNSPATSSTCMNSPPGIFFCKPPVNGMKNEPRAKATPDQSNHRKSGRRKKPNLEKFKSEISEMVKKCLYPFQKAECKAGKIVTAEDFKFLCKKFTNEIYAKEVKSGKTDLVVNETVKNKSKGYIKKYMNTRGPVFRIDHSPASHDTDNVACSMNDDDDDVAEEEGVRDEFNENSFES